MADTSGKAFWSDLSKKTGTWTAVAALVVVVAEQAEDWLDSSQGLSGRLAPRCGCSGSCCYQGHSWSSSG